MSEFGSSGRGGGKRGTGKAIDPAASTWANWNAQGLPIPQIYRKLAGGRIHDAGWVVPRIQRHLELHPEPAAQGGVQRKQAAGGSANGGVKIPEGGGAPLPGGLKGKMQQKLGTDLSDVKIHTGGDSAQASEDLNAKAFTTGTDVHFNAGQFDPDSKEGEKLIAHELTHVAQNKNGGVQRKGEEGGEEAEGADGVQLEVSDPDEPAEQEADAKADEIVQEDESEEGDAPEQTTQIVSRAVVHRTPTNPPPATGTGAPAAGTPAKDPKVDALEKAGLNPADADTLSKCDGRDAPFLVSLVPVVKAGRPAAEVAQLAASSVGLNADQIRGLAAVTRDTAGLVAVAEHVKSGKPLDKVAALAPTSVGLQPDQVGALAGVEQVAGYLVEVAAHVKAGMALDKVLALAPSEVGIAAAAVGALAAVDRDAGFLVQVAAHVKGGKPVEKVAALSGSGPGLTADQVGTLAAVEQATPYLVEVAAHVKAGKPIDLVAALAASAVGITVDQVGQLAGVDRPATYLVEVAATVKAGKPIEKVVALAATSVGLQPDQVAALSAIDRPPAYLVDVAAAVKGGGALDKVAGLAAPALNLEADAVVKLTPVNRDLGYLTAIAPCVATCPAADLAKLAAPGVAVTPEEMPKVIADPRPVDEKVTYLTGSKTYEPFKKSANADAIEIEMGPEAPQPLTFKIADAAGPAALTEVVDSADIGGAKNQSARNLVQRSVARAQQVETEIKKVKPLVGRVSPADQTTSETSGSELVDTTKASTDGMLITKLKDAAQAQPSQPMSSKSPKLSFNADTAGKTQLYKDQFEKEMKVQLAGHAEKLNGKSLDLFVFDNQRYAFDTTTFLALDKSARMALIGERKARLQTAMDNASNKSREARRLAAMKELEDKEKANAATGDRADPTQPGQGAADLVPDRRVLTPPRPSNPKKTSDIEAGGRIENATGPAADRHKASGGIQALINAALGKAPDDSSADILQIAADWSAIMEEAGAKLAILHYADQVAGGPSMADDDITIPPDAANAQKLNTEEWQEYLVKLRKLAGPKVVNEAIGAGWQNNAKTLLDHVMSIPQEAHPLQKLEVELEAVV